MRRHIPKQQEIDQLLKEFRRKQIKEWNLPIDALELAKEYAFSPRFRDVYLYITKNKLPSSSASHRRLQMDATNYVVINNLLFRIPCEKEHSSPTKWHLKLVIPEKFETTLFHKYHSSPMGGHMGIKRTIATLNEWFYVVNMVAKFKIFQQSCEVCQRTGKAPGKGAPRFPRIPQEYTPFDGISCDIKYMPQGLAGYKFLLVATCELTNYTIAIPLMDRLATTIAHALWTRILCVFTIPRLLIVDEDKSFTANVVAALTEFMGIKTKIISPYNHGSLKTERQIQTIQNIITKCLEAEGEKWPLYAAQAAKAMNSFASEALAGFSPHELVFLKPPRNLLLDMDFGIQQIESEYPEYVKMMKKRKEFLERVFLEFRKTQAKISATKVNQYAKYPKLKEGDLVACLAPHAASLETNTEKFRQDFIGPIVVDTQWDDTHFKLRDLVNNVLPGTYHIRRLKPWSEYAAGSAIRTQDELLRELRSCEVNLGQRVTIPSEEARDNQK